MASTNHSLQKAESLSPSQRKPQEPILTSGGGGASDWTPEYLYQPPDHHLCEVDVRVGGAFPTTGWFGSGETNRK